MIRVFYTLRFLEIRGSQVDYTIEGLNQGVKFINPNASAVCGCGESFTVKDEKFNSDTSTAQKKKLKYCPMR